MNATPRGEVNQPCLRLSANVVAWILTLFPGAPMSLLRSPMWFVLLVAITAGVVLPAVRDLVLAVEATPAERRPGRVRIVHITGEGPIRHNT